MSCRVNVTGTVLETPSLGSLLPVGTAAPADFSGWQGLGQSQEERERHSAGSPGWLWWLAGLDGPLTIQLEDLVLLFFSLHSGHLSTPSEDKHQAGNGELREGMNELTHTCLCWSCEQASSLQRGRRYMYSLGSPPPGFCYLCNFKDRGFRGRSTKCWRQGMHTRLTFATASSVTRIIWFLRYKGNFTMPPNGS